MSRVYNFSAGPAVLPEEVLKEAQAEMLDYKDTGMSVMTVYLLVSTRMVNIAWLILWIVMQITHWLILH